MSIFCLYLGMAISKGQSWPDILEKIRSHGVRVVWILFGIWIVINIIVANKKSASFINSIQGNNNEFSLEKSELL
ncbi:hypothetical protein Anas_10420 [Armadillidium nasatum]|uniref:Uncharacterized protein n=1 Tax=Armadillidium nasatum TaxID=96803 RepID=A0A5N5TLS2_9CRUS|nr:hypothetical protein Anas_10420 [Armadillidium nasatum]